MIIDRVGSSTADTYVVATSLSRHVSPSVSGFMLAEMTVSMSGYTSALSITWQQLRSALIAASLIEGFGSCDTSISLTTMLGSVAETDLGLAAASSANMVTAASFVCQRCSSNCLKRSGSMPSTAAGLRQAIIAAPASSALICTLRSLSAARAMMDGKSVMRYGSTQSFFSALAHLQMSVTVIIAASLESLASAAFAMAVATALADALSVCSRRVFAASLHGRSSGSLDICCGLLCFLRAREGRGDQHSQNVKLGNRARA